MVLQQLIERFENVNQLPVEIPEVRDAIISLGVQDEIRFCPDDKVDTAVLRGLYYQYTSHSAPYSEPTFCSLIVFSKSLPKEWQRLIACKELMHVLDNKSERTNTLKEIDGLLNRLLGPLSSEDFDIFDVMATKDRLALYQAIPILFPEAARQDALVKIASGSMKLTDVAEKACLPSEFVGLALTPEWPDLIKRICC